MLLATLSAYELATVVVLIVMPMAIALLVRVRRGHTSTARRRPEDSRR